MAARRRDGGSPTMSHPAHDANDVAMASMTAPQCGHSADVPAAAVGWHTQVETMSRAFVKKHVIMLVAFKGKAAPPSAATLGVGSRPMTDSMSCFEPVVATRHGESIVGVEGSRHDLASADSTSPATHSAIAFIISRASTKGLRRRSGEPVG